VTPIEPAHIVLAGARVALNELLGFLQKDQRALDEEWTRQKEELLFEVTAHLQRIIEMCGSVDAQVTELIAHRAWVATQLEALRSPDEERVRMLAAALAGYCKPDLSLDRKNRALRVTHRLEPSDARLLQRLANYPGDHRNHGFHERSSWDALTAAGCFELRGVGDDDKPNYAVSNLGQDVVNLLMTYTPPAPPQINGLNP
jgi:hypothetical protein